MKLIPVLAAMTMALAGTACTDTNKKADTGTTTDATASATPASACPDDGPQFAGTGLCVGRAVNYIDPANLAADDILPEGCSWQINETMLPGDEALLYQAMSCNGKTTELEFRGGAQTAALGVKQSGFFDTVPADYEPVRILSLFEVADAQARILDFARAAITDPEEAAACAVRPVGGDAPADAFVVDASDAFKQARNLVDAEAPGEAYSVCGPFGYSSESLLYWRITGGYAFLFDTGQDVADFNPNSLTVIRKSATGSWDVVQ
jgi:hypothetical protein